MNGDKLSPITQVCSFELNGNWMLHNDIKYIKVDIFTIFLHDIFLRGFSQMLYLYCCHLEWQRQNDSNLFSLVWTSLAKHSQTLLVKYVNKYTTDPNLTNLNSCLFYFITQILWMWIGNDSFKTWPTSQSFLTSTMLIHSSVLITPSWALCGH